MEKMIKKLLEYLVILEKRYGIILYVKVIKTVADSIGSVVLPMQCKTNERGSVVVYLSSFNVDVYIWHVLNSIANVYRQKKISFITVKDSYRYKKTVQCNFGQFVDGFKVNLAV